MKKTLIVISTFLMIAQSNAQKGGTELTIKGGITLPKYSYLNGGSSEDRSVYQGITAGITLMQYKISRDNPGLGFGLSIDYLQAGAINKQPAIAGAVEAKNRITYIRTTGLFGAKIQNFLEISGGLYLAKAISGESVVTKTGGATTTTAFSFGDKSTYDFIPFDLGYAINANFNISKVKIGLSLHEGLSDIAPQTDIKIRNSIYSITLGLRLGGGKKND
jgi:hypothetical protein